MDQFVASLKSLIPAEGEPKVYAFAGKARSGKSTAAAIMTREIKGKVQVCSFAAPLKRAVENTIVKYKRQVDSTGHGNIKLRSVSSVVAEFGIPYSDDDISMALPLCNAIQKYLQDDCSKMNDAEHKEVLRPVLIETGRMIRNMSMVRNISMLQKPTMLKSLPDPIVEAMKLDILRLLKSNCNVVIDDLRFGVEYEMLKEFDTIFCRIESKNAINLTDSSEHDLDNVELHTIKNDRE